MKAITIKVGDTVVCNNQEVLITKEEKDRFIGVLERKGRSIEVFIFKSTLTNPHYVKNMSVKNGGTENTVEV